MKKLLATSMLLSIISQCSAMDQVPFIRSKTPRTPTLHSPIHISGLGAVRIFTEESGCCAALANPIMDKSIKALFASVLEDDIESFCKLATPKNINAIEPFWKRTLLHFAALKGHNKIVKFLLKNRVPCDSKDVFGNTPLILAIESFQYSTVMMLILVGNADVNIPLYNETPKDLVINIIKKLKRQAIPDRKLIAEWELVLAAIESRGGITYREHLVQCRAQGTTSRSESATPSLSPSPSPTPCSFSALSSPLSRSASATPLSPVTIIDQPRAPVAVRPVAASSSALYHLPETVSESKQHTNQHSCCIASMSSSGTCLCTAPAQSSSSKEQAIQQQPSSVTHISAQCKNNLARKSS